MSCNYCIELLSIFHTLNFYTSYRKRYFPSCPSNRPSLLFVVIVTWQHGYMSNIQNNFFIYLTVHKYNTI